MVSQVKGRTMLEPVKKGKLYKDSFLSLLKILIRKIRLPMYLSLDDSKSCAHSFLHIIISARLQLLRLCYVDYLTVPLTVKPDWGEHLIGGILLNKKQYED